MSKPKESITLPSGNSRGAVSSESKQICLEDLSPKLQHEIFSYLDVHNLLKCRLLSKKLKAQVDALAELRFQSRRNDKFGWNPYFTVRRYFDIDSKNILGLVRLQCTADVKRFVEQNTLPITDNSNTPSTSSSAKPATKSPRTSAGGNSGKTPPKPKTLPRPTRPPVNSSRPPANSKPPPNSTFKPSTKTTRAPQPPAKPPAPPTSPKKNTSKKPSNFESSFFSFPESSTSPPPLEPPRPSSTLFPLGSIHIRRRLQDYVDDDKKTSSPPADTTASIMNWTTRLVTEFGTQITSFTYDDGKRKGSDLSFAHLRTILSHLPNLIFLGITSGNYEHYFYEENQDEHGIERFPPLENLKYASLGYNTTYHLHMDILNSYGSQLKRITSSKFGYLFGTLNISTNNTLQKLLDYVNTLRETFPLMLSSLEELKAPILSSQNLMHEIEVVAAASPIIWSNLKRLSVIYMHRAGLNDCTLVDMFLFLNVLSPTLEEFCLDFEQCSDFIEWISVDPRPLSRDVLQPCRRLRKFCVSAVSLLKHGDMNEIIASKFPKLRTLTIFNWWQYYAQCEQNNFEGKYFSGGPRGADVVSLCVDPFWTKNSHLQRISVRIETWKDEYIYRKTRSEAILL